MQSRGCNRKCAARFRVIVGCHLPPPHYRSRFPSLSNFLQFAFWWKYCLKSAPAWLTHFKSGRGNPTFFELKKKSIRKLLHFNRNFSIRMLASTENYVLYIQRLNDHTTPVVCCSPYSWAWSRYPISALIPKFSVNRKSLYLDNESSLALQEFFTDTFVILARTTWHFQLWP